MKLRCPNCGSAKIETVVNSYADCTITYYNCMDIMDDDTPCGFSTWNPGELQFREPDGYRYIGGGKFIQNQGR